MARIREKTLKFPGLNNTYTFADEADLFDPSVACAVGEYRIYNGDLYCCTTAHTGAWDASHFKTVKMGKEVSELKSAINVFSPMKKSSNFSWTIGKNITSTGSVANAVGFALSGYIDVRYPTLIINDTTDKGTNNKNTAFWLATYTRVNNAANFQARTQVLAGDVFAIPEGIEYIRIGYGYPNAESVTMTEELLAQYFSCQIIEQAEIMWKFGYRRVLNANDNLDTLGEYGVYRINSIDLPSGIPEAVSGIFVYYGTLNKQIKEQIIYTLTGDIYMRYCSAYTNWAYWSKHFQVTRFYNIPVLDLYGDTSEMTADNAVTLTYSLFGTTGTCTAKWQGSSSLRYPKKNYTIVFDNGFDGWYQYATYVNGVRTADGNRSSLDTTSRWGTQTKFCFKANWVDASMARNIVCARLWGQIVKDRVTDGDITDNRKDSPNYGAIDGFPIQIRINGNPIGLYTLNIPKDKWLFDMGEESTEYLVAGEENSSNACKWKATALVDGTDYSVEYAPDGVSDSTIATSLNAAITAAINAGSDWETTLASYVDIDSVFDYFIFICCTNAHDNLAKNILYGTYDGNKWFLSAYDLDTTFGVDPYGTSWFNVVNDRNQFAEAATIHQLAYLMFTHSKAKLKTRYQELRSTILSDENVWHELSQFIVNIPDIDYQNDRQIWINEPGTALANIAQYMDYYRMHCAYLDSEIAAL